MEHCSSCQRRSYSGQWWGYWCPRCGEHDDGKYRREHVRPEIAKHLTRADIEAEYAAAGMAFLPPRRAA